MSTSIYLKSSSVTSKVPTTSALSLRELGVNTADGILYLRQGTGVAGDSIIPINPWKVSTGGTTIYNTYFTVGNVGVGTTNPSQKFHVVGNSYVTGARYDSNNATGTSGQVLTSTGTGTSWFTRQTLTFGTYLTGTSYNGTSAVTIGVAATSVNTANNIVVRDASGNFSAGTITATLSGSASTLTTTRTLWGQNFDGSANVTGDLSSVGNITGTGAVNLTATSGTLGLVATGANIITASTNGSERVRIDSSGNVGISTNSPSVPLDVLGKVQIQQDAGSNNRLIFRGTSGSSYRWNIDNYQSDNTLRIFREDDGTSANGFVAASISPTGTVTATKFVGDGSGLTGIVATGSGVVIQNQGSTVGTASTINFSTNLTATLSSGVATITATGGGGGSATYGGYQPVDLLEAMLFV